MAPPFFPHNNEKNFPFCQADSPFLPDKNRPLLFPDKYFAPNSGSFRIFTETQKVLHFFLSLFLLSPLV